MRAVLLNVRGCQGGTTSKTIFAQLSQRTLAGDIALTSMGAGFARPLSASPPLPRRRLNEVEFSRPGQEDCSGLLPLLVGLRAFKPVKHLVAIIDARTALVLAQKRYRIGERADDAAVAHAQPRLQVIFARIRHSK